MNIPTPLELHSCAVCGSTAIYTNRDGRRLCSGHVGVCTPHLLDPCPTCDTNLEEVTHP